MLSLSVLSPMITRREGMGALLCGLLIVYLGRRGPGYIISVLQIHVTIIKRVHMKHAANTTIQHKPHTSPSRARDGSWRRSELAEARVTLDHERARLVLLEEDIPLVRAFVPANSLQSVGPEEQRTLLLINAHLLWHEDE